MLNTAVLAPIPTARVSKETTVKALDLRSCRRAKRQSEMRE